MLENLALEEFDDTNPTDFNGPGIPEEAPATLHLVPEESSPAQPYILSEEQRSLCEGIIGLVVSIAGKFGDRNLELEDLIQEGCVGLLDAARRFDPSRGIEFSTFAAPRIKGAISDAIRRSGPLTRSQHSRLADYTRNEDKLSQQLQKQPTIEEIAEKTGISPEEARELLSLFALYKPASIDAPTSIGTSRFEHPLSPHEVLPDIHSIDEDDIIRGVMTDARMGVIRKKLLSATDRERTILRERGEGLTLGQIGERFGITESRISQIQTGLFIKLRREFKKDGNAHLIP